MDKYKLYKGAWLFVERPHLENHLSDEVVSQLLSLGGVMVRNTFDFDCQRETSFWYVIKDSFGGMDELSSKMRNQVKKSLKVYDVKRISPKEFKRIALAIYNSALKNYRVKASLTSQENINSMAERAEKSEGNVHIWAVYNKEDSKPVAIAYNTVHEDCCEYNTLKCDPAYQRNSTYPYYGLIYEMNRYYLQELGLRYVSDGVRSITEHSNIQPFLIEKFRFRKAYCRLDIYYKWWFGLIVKCLYSFRTIISVKSVRSVLEMERMARTN